jgi:hypothetical protein
MTLRKINIVVGSVQLLVNLFVIIPLVNTLLNTYRGFGYGIVVVSVAIPVLYASFFAFFTFFDYEKHFYYIKRLLIVAYSLAAVVCLISFATTFFVPFPLLGIPLCIGLTLKIKKENIGKRLLITNILVVILQLLIIFFIPR